MNEYQKICAVSGHGRLMNPPARNSMWRLDFPNPINYRDDELYCGGFSGITLDNIPVKLDLK